MNKLLPLIVLAVSVTFLTALPNAYASNPMCGDGVLDTGFSEVCDDGNFLSGDGCSSNTCQVEPGWECTSVPFETSVCTLIPPPEIVGGQIIPVDSTALLLAGIQSSTIWMLPVLAGAAGAGFAAFKLRRK